MLDYISLHKLLLIVTLLFTYLFNVYSQITKCSLVKLNIDDLIYGFNLSSMLSQHCFFLYYESYFPSSLVIFD